MRHPSSFRMCYVNLKCFNYKSTKRHKQQQRQQCVLWMGHGYTHQTLFTSDTPNKIRKTLVNKWAMNTKLTQKLDLFVTHTTIINIFFFCLFLFGSRTESNPILWSRESGGPNNDGGTTEMVTVCPHKNTENSALIPVVYWGWGHIPNSQNTHPKQASIWSNERTALAAGVFGSCIYLMHIHSPKIELIMQIILLFIHHLILHE